MKKEKNNNNHFLLDRFTNNFSPFAAQSNVYPKSNASPKEGAEGEQVED